VSLGLRARAAVASLELFGFNPHQRRGPDGRFIKMADHELKRPRRGGSGGDAQYRKRREGFNDEIIRDAIEQREGFGNPAMHPEIDQIGGMPPGAERDALIDQMVERINDRIPDPNDRYVPPPPGRGPRQAAVVENPLYRQRREKYNTEVVLAVEALRKLAQRDTSDIQKIQAMPPGPERDARIDLLADEFNDSLSPDDRYVPPFVPPNEGPRLAPRLAATTERPGLTAPYARRRAALARSVRTGATQEQTLAQGLMGETRRFDLADGTSAVYKRATRDWDRGWDRPVWTKKEQIDAEELSSRVAAALEVPAPAVHRSGDDEIYMEFMPGVDPDIRWEFRGGRPSRGSLVSPEGVKFGLLDVLIANTDRHAGNFLVDGDDHPVAIDHGMAFNNTYHINERGEQVLDDRGLSSATGEYALHNFVDLLQNRQKSNPLTASDVAHVRRQLAKTRREFERLGRLDWYEAMQRRMDQVADLASGDEDVYR